MNKKRVFAVGSAAAVSLLMAVPAFADTSSTTPQTSQTPTHQFRKGTGHAPAGVIGTVAAVDGSSLTVTGKNGTTYTVDASNATVQKGFGKDATTLAISDVAVNDAVAVQGTVSGDSVTATKILDGLPTRANKAPHQKLANVAFGTVASVDGSSITLTRTLRGGTTSTVTVQTTDSTTYKKNGKADTVSDIAVGQRIVAMGTKDSSGNITNATSVNIMIRQPHVASTTAATAS